MGQNVTTQLNSLNLTGQMLVAMPGMADPRFARSVILICAHGPEGAMGLVINRHYGTMHFNDLAAQLNISPADNFSNPPVHYGGPVESTRGFVVHSTDYRRPDTLIIDDDLAVTHTVDILRAVADNRGPLQHLMALGYAGWSAGQLETEIQANGWLIVPADAALIFSTDIDHKWEAAIGKLGFHPAMLSMEAGHA
ncbi:MAG: YqgE/AlgH family protein [Alphaproteobacteria bacterium]